MRYPRRTFIAGTPKHLEIGLLSSTLYLVIMVGIIALVTLVSVPSLFLRKCPECGKRNSLEAPVCRSCGAALPEEED